MSSEEKENMSDPDLSSNASEAGQTVERLQAQLEAGRAQEPPREFVRRTKDQLRQLSDEQLKAEIQILKERIKLEQGLCELDRKAVNLGLLKLANQAPRCSHLKADGSPCRAPAAGNNLFCWFHLRALESEDGPRMKVRILEDRHAVLLTVKQIMDQVIHEQISAHTAAVLLRGVQIASSTFKPPLGRALRSQTRDVRDDRNGDDDAEELRKLSDEELEAEIADLQKRLAPFDLNTENP